MTRIEFASAVSEDFDRILDHLEKHEIADTHSRIEEIIQAIDVLQSNPLVGRPVRGKMRELIIGRQSRGHVALYQYVEEVDIVFVLAIRSQKEAGYNLI